MSFVWSDCKGVVRHVDNQRGSGARSLEEKFGTESGMASTEAERIEVLIGGRSGVEELQRQGVYALVQRILCTRHELLGINTLTREKMPLPRRFHSHQKCYSQPKKSELFAVIGTQH